MIHSYLYYVLDETLISDGEFNQMCQQLILDWDKLEHPHKHLVTLEDLKASTGAFIKFPKMVEGAAYQVLRDHRLALTLPPPKPVLTRVKAKIKML